MVRHPPGVNVGLVGPLVGPLIAPPQEVAATAPAPAGACAWEGARCCLAVSGILKTVRLHPPSWVWLRTISLSRDHPITSVKQELVATSGATTVVTHLITWYIHGQKQQTILCMS